MDAHYEARLPLSLNLPVGNLSALFWQLALLYVGNHLAGTALASYNLEICIAHVIATSSATISCVLIATRSVDTLYCYCAIVGSCSKGDGPAAIIWNSSDRSPCCNCAGPWPSSTLESHTSPPAGSGAQLSPFMLVTAQTSRGSRRGSYRATSRLRGNNGVITHCDLS